MNQTQQPGVQNPWLQNSGLPSSATANASASSSEQGSTLKVHRQQVTFADTNFETFPYLSNSTDPTSTSLANNQGTKRQAGDTSSENDIQSEQNKRHNPGG